MESTYSIAEHSYIPSDITTDNETVTKFEIMDGAPVREECIPVRLYLSGNELGLAGATALASAKRTCPRTSSRDPIGGESSSSRRSEH